MNIPPLISRSPPPLDDGNNDDEDEEDEISNIIDPLDGVITDHDSIKPDFLYIKSKCVKTSEEVTSGDVIFESHLPKNWEHDISRTDSVCPDGSITHIPDDLNLSHATSACLEKFEVPVSPYKTESEDPLTDSLSVNIVQPDVSSSHSSVLTPMYVNDDLEYSSIKYFNDSKDVPVETNPNDIPSYNLTDFEDIPPSCTGNSNSYLKDISSSQDIQENPEDIPAESIGPPDIYIPASNQKGKLVNDSKDILPVTVSNPEEIPQSIVQTAIVNLEENLEIPSESIDVQENTSAKCCDIPEHFSSASSLNSKVVLPICDFNNIPDNSNLDSSRRRIVEQTKEDFIGSQTDIDESLCKSDHQSTSNYRGFRSSIENVKNEIFGQGDADQDSDNDSFDDFVSFNPVVPIEPAQNPADSYHTCEPSVSQIAVDGRFDPTTDEFGDYSDGFATDEFTDFTSFDSTSVTTASNLEVPFFPAEDHVSDVYTKDILPLCLNEALKSNNVWWSLSNFDSTPALTYRWTASSANRKLLSALRIDSRNILAAPWNRSISLKGVSSDDCKYMAGESECSTNLTENKAAVPQPHFDWVGSGLVNPLDGGGNSNLLDVQLLSFALTSSKNTSLLPFNQKAHFSQAKGSTLSFEATSFLQSLPDLSYMHQRCIIFPKRVK